MKIVQIGDFIGVVAEREENAAKAAACDALRARACVVLSATTSSGST